MEAMLFLGDLLSSLWQQAVMYSAELIGFFMPVIIEVLNKDIKKDSEKWIVTVLACLGAATLTKWNSVISGNGHDLAKSMFMIFFESQGVYRLYFKNSALRQKLQDVIEEKKEEPVKN